MILIIYHYLSILILSVIILLRENAKCSLYEGVNMRDYLCLFWKMIREYFCQLRKKSRRLIHVVRESIKDLCPGNTMGELMQVVDALKQQPNIKRLKLIQGNNTVNISMRVITPCGSIPIKACVRITETDVLVTGHVILPLFLWLFFETRCIERAMEWLEETSPFAEEALFA